MKRLVHPELHIDEFKSKLGQDKDICVVSFKVSGKEPGVDLVSFIEKSYDWVIDADVSSGEMDDGDYIVFVELDRTPKLGRQILELMEDLMNLTDQKISDWRVRYRTSLEDHELDADEIEKIVPTTSEEYERRFGTEELDKLRTAAGIDVKTKAPKNDFTESLRVAAGIK